MFGLFKKKKETQQDERYLTLTIREVVHIAQDAVNLVFEQPSGKFTYEPGQFITIIDEVNGQKIRRAYSLCTSPFLDNYPAVTVKRVLGGLMSNHINDTFRAGQQVQVMEPMGKFTTTFQATNTRHAVFIGGGSGITPLYAILRTILDKEPNSKVALVYGNRSEEFIIFKKELSELKSRYADRLEVVHILESDPQGITTYHGRPTVEMLGEILLKLGASPQTEYYLCGPEPMMEIVSQGLSAAQVAPGQIRKESFEAKSSGTTAKASEVSTLSQVTIVMDGETHVLEVPRSKSILDAGLEAGLDMPYSCQSGLCTACRGKCLEGKVSLDEAEGISQSELDEGYVLLCVGKPLTDTVKIEVG